MTQEEIQLVLIDLCARLPYMPKIKITYQQQGVKGTDEGRVSCDFIEKIVNDLRNGVITDIQIYLRPMSSMTEEEKKDALEKDIAFIDSGTHDGIRYGGETIQFIYEIDTFDWLNAHHFDYRGLIEKRLAISTEEYNPYKE